MFKMISIRIRDVVWRTPAVVANALGVSGAQLNADAKSWSWAEPCWYTSHVEMTQSQLKSGHVSPWKIVFKWSKSNSNQKHIQNRLEKSASVDQFSILSVSDNFWSLRVYWGFFFGGGWVEQLNSPATKLGFTTWLVKPCATTIGQCVQLLFPHTKGPTWKFIILTHILKEELHISTIGNILVCCVCVCAFKISICIGHVQRNTPLERHVGLRISLGQIGLVPLEDKE